MIKKVKIFLNNYFKGTTRNLEFKLTNISKLKNTKYLKNTSDIADIWIVDSSSSLNNKSLFNAFSFFLKKELEKNNISYLNLICASGPGFCQIGASPKNPNNPMPCQTCVNSSIQSNKNNIYFSTKKEFYEENFDLNIIKDLISPSKKWILRESRSKKTAENLEEKLIEASFRWIDFLNNIDGDKLPKTAFIFNGYSFPEVIIKNHLENRGVKTFTYESGFIENSIFVTKTYAPELFFDFKKRSLNSEEKTMLKNYVDRRRVGNFDRAGTNFWSEITELTEDYLNIFSNFENIITIFLNVPFDTSQKSSNKLFKDIYDWVDCLKLIVEQNKENLFIFRSHPDENRPDKTSNTPVSDYIKDLYKGNDENIMIIDAESSISSYELIENSSLVLTYNSSISLEAFYLNTNVINAGYAHFARIPYFELSQNKDSYIEKINNLLDNNEIDQEAYSEVESYFFQLVFESSIDLSNHVIKTGKYDYITSNEKNFKNKKLELLISNLKKEI